MALDLATRRMIQGSVLLVMGGFYVGRGVDRVDGTLLGWVFLVVPPTLFVFAGLLVLGRALPRPGRPSSSDNLQRGI